MKTIISWNVNGLRQRHTMNEFLPLFQHNPDIVCIQETKTPEEKIPEELRKIHGYSFYCSPVTRDNFAEVALFSRETPVSLRYGFGNTQFDEEGRIIIAEFPAFILLNIYFPLGIAPVDTLEHKLAFYDAFLQFVRELRGQGKPVIICGDFSIAHTDNDVESVRKHAARQVGTMADEREKIDQLIRIGYKDVIRMFSRGKGPFTWWPNGFRVHERHLGRRLDYFFVNEQAEPLVLGSEILSAIEGSDHCPILLEINQ